MKEFHHSLHHGSLSKEQRLRVESEMSKGHLKAVIATSSLDLGIDWNSVDHIINLEHQKVSIGLYNALVDQDIVIISE